MLLLLRGRGNTVAAATSTAAPLKERVHARTLRTQPWRNSNAHLHFLSVHAQHIQQPPSNVIHTVREASVIVESLRGVLPLFVSPYSFLECPGQEQIMPGIVGAAERSPAKLKACREHTNRVNSEKVILKTTDNVVASGEVPTPHTLAFPGRILRNISLTTLVPVR